MCIRSQSSERTTLGRLRLFGESSPARRVSAATKKRPLEAVRRRVGSPRAISSARLSTPRSNQNQNHLSDSSLAFSGFSGAGASFPRFLSARVRAPSGSVAPSVVLPRSRRSISLATSLSPLSIAARDPKKWDPKEEVGASGDASPNAPNGNGNRPSNAGTVGKGNGGADGSPPRQLDVSTRRSEEANADPAPKIPGGGSSFVSVRVRSSSSGSLRVGTARSWGRVRDGRRGCAREGAAGCARSRARGNETKDSERSGRMTGRTGGDARGPTFQDTGGTSSRCARTCAAGRHSRRARFCTSPGTRKRRAGGRARGQRGDERARARIERASEGAEGAERVRVRRTVSDVEKEHASSPSPSREARGAPRSHQGVVSLMTAPRGRRLRDPATLIISPPPRKLIRRQRQSFVSVVVHRRDMLAPR